jgi:type IV secretory pathway ATPase VirB11/archaellum biosynthesis ATPase
MPYHLNTRMNGADCVLIERQGLLEPVTGVRLGDRALMVAVEIIARRLGDDISEAKPILDSRLLDGSLVAAVIPPCSLRGVTLTIRKFSARQFEIGDLIGMGTLDRPLAKRKHGELVRQNFRSHALKSLAIEYERLKCGHRDCLVFAFLPEHVQKHRRHWPVSVRRYRFTTP